MDIFLAIVLGMLFGLVLQRVGAADPDKIVGMLRLTDLHLMKTILTGIGIASALLFLGLMMGWGDAGNLSIKTLSWGVIVGGLLLGFGWALAGFCPGTGIAAAGSGRKDALFFVLGGLVGAGMFVVMYEMFDGGELLAPLLGGNSSLVVTGKSTPLIAEEWSPAIAVSLALLMLLLAKWMPTHLR